MRRFHRWLGVGATVFVLLSVITGLLWAYGPYLFWGSGYREKKHPDPIASYEAIKLTPGDAIRVAREQLGSTAVISTITLRSDLGKALYELTATVDGKERAALIDGNTGVAFSPLTPELATQIARQYVHGEPPLKAVTLLDQFKHRSGKIHESVYQVQFQAEKNPELFISAQSGQLIEDQDDSRRIHFWVMRLHQLNFFGFKKTLTIIPGTALLMLTFSGLWLSRRRKARSLRPTRATEPAPERAYSE